MSQINIFAEPGIRLRDQGMARAVTHADEVLPQWSTKAYNLLLEYLKIQKAPFLTENVREFAFTQGLDTPPSERAWGGVIARAAKNGMIERIGFANVRNARAHATPASLWRAQ